MPPRLLDKLACPQCRGQLEYRAAEERLICPACRVGFTIRQGVPVLLIDEAIKFQ